MTRSTSIVFVLALLSCVPPAVPTVEEADGGVETDAAMSVCEKMCANLVRNGCPEGSPDGGLSCVAICEKIRVENKFNIKAECNAVATTVDAIRACGTIVCKK